MCGRFVSFLSGVDLLQLLSYQLQTLSLNMRNVTTLCHKKTQLGKGSETFRAPGHKEFNRLQVSAHGKPTRSSKPTSPRLLKRRPIARKEEDIRNQAIITKGSSDYANCPITADFLTTSIPYCLESPFRFSRGLILTTDGDFCITRDAYWGRPESAPKGSDIFSGSYWPKHIFELFDSSFACQLLELELLGLELSSYDVHCYSVALCPKVLCGIANLADGNP
ncbi:hypothetical protein BCR43DRAFT_325737 [Syncephalastrum racemosum]|uniref:Uncharacterized protein n=1 Tax=Syncephalastrum racemosum TaxID=13706 RepID=A0A1X2H7T7_SYNRA|nr:hypothetical protein BCR43DRAFT_325737 [Syncephalastrum racemosum]